MIDHSDNLGVDRELLVLVAGFDPLDRVDLELRLRLAELAEISRCPCELARPSCGGACLARSIGPRCAGCCSTARPIVDGMVYGFKLLLSGTANKAYCARDACYSDGYARTLTSGQQQMLLVDVVVGLASQVHEAAAAGTRCARYSPASSSSGTTRW